MPRGQKKQIKQIEQPASSTNSQNSVGATVANVSTDDMATEDLTLDPAKNSKRRAPRNKAAIKTSKRSKKERYEEMPEDEIELAADVAELAVTFQEEDEIIHMSMQNADESYVDQSQTASEDDEYDQEISFRNSQSTSDDEDNEQVEYTTGEDDGENCSTNAQNTSRSG